MNIKNSGVNFLRLSINKLNGSFFSIISFLLLSALVILSLDHYVDGNIVIYPLHAYELVTNGTLSFQIYTEDVTNVFYPNFHAFLYTLYLSLVFKIFNIFHELDPYSINIAIKFANLSLILLTGYIFSLFFYNKDEKNRHLILAYTLLPSSILGYLCVVEDQVLTPIFLLLTFYLIEKNRNIFWIILAGTFSILSKETTGTIGLIFILFGEVFFLNRVSVFKAIKIFFTSSLLALILYLWLCYIFNLDPLFIIYTTSGHLAGGGFRLENIVIQSRYLLQAFTPFLIVFLPLFFNKKIFENRKLLFTAFIFLSINAINVITGYINIRYLSAFIPLMLVLIVQSSVDKSFYNIKTLLVAILLAITFIAVVDDPYILLSNLSEKSFNELIYILSMIILFCFASITINRINQFKNFYFLVIVSPLIYLNLSIKDYQIGYSHGLQQIKPIIELIDENKYIFTDLPTPEFYFRNQVIYTTDPISHFFSKTSWGGDGKSLSIDLESSNKIHDVLTNDRQNFITAKASNLSEFYVWTLNNTDTRSFFESNYFCNTMNKSNERSVDHILLECSNPD
ncbi:MAG: hypothetical protein VX590_03930 [Chloroflexota bacterium]|nr:hypothetical protein [Chloroflexota bacterium]